MSLVQFFLNHRRIMRSECPQRAGRSPIFFGVGPSKKLLRGDPAPRGPARRSRTPKYKVVSSTGKKLVLEKPDGEIVALFRVE